ncbi:MAG: RNA polymerase sporulation sigma factor SigK [Firmicutes bacterium]|nr:RNA polymerase sporulation sigma factor SigK [Bacillota bacterium]MBQ9973024.1 RNA polymerase sporulation sigma factor SigK [Bacillota bacterium]
MSDSFPMPLDAKEEEYYLKLFQDGDEDARRVLIERNLRLVAHIAKKYTATGSGPDDLISIGTIGLIKAVNTYRSGRSTRLATYAAKCIDNEILMSLRAGKKNKGDISLDEPLGTDKDGNEISFNDILGSDPDSIIDDINLKMQIHSLYEAVMSELTPREKYVIIHRYGICNCESRAQREVADALGISRSYVSRIEKKALEKLREKLKQ